MASAKSFSPFPETAATPNISPPYNSKDIFLNPILLSVGSTKTFFNSRIGFGLFGVSGNSTFGSALSVTLISFSMNIIFTIFSVVIFSLFKVPWTFPLLNIVTLSHASTTSLILCVINIIVTPFLTNDFNVLNKSLNSLSTRDVVGSSRIKSFAPL